MRVLLGGGSVRGWPLDRLLLGPWLAWADEWDGLIVAMHNRLTRSLLDFLMLYKRSATDNVCVSRPELAPKRSPSGSFSGRWHVRRWRFSG